MAQQVDWARPKPGTQTEPGSPAYVGRAQTVGPFSLAFQGTFSGSLVVPGEARIPTGAEMWNDSIAGGSLAA